MKPSPVRQALLFVAVAVVVVGVFVGLALGVQRYNTWTAESFGDRRLATPVADECGVARAVVDQVHAQDQTAWLRAVHAGAEDRLALRAFAWRSNGPRVGRGADWRGCKGLGAYVRENLGFQRMASGEEGPMVFISRPDFATGRDAQVYETLYPPIGDPTQPRTWRVSLNKTSGEWRITSREAAEAPRR